MALEFVSGFILSSLLQEVVDRIRASVTDKLALAYSDVEKELKSLESSYMKGVVVQDNVDGWDLITSKPHRDWVADVRRACYSIEDFTEHIRIEIVKNKGDTGFLRSYWTSWSLSSKIQDLKSNLNDCLSVSDQFVGSTRRLNDPRHLALKTEPLIVLDDDSFRRKNEKESIIKVLLRPTSRSTNTVILIAGMFGLGKTTLIQVVKNDSRIQHHFDNRLWVSVSGDFSLGKVLCSMIVDMQRERINEPDSRLSLPFSEQQYITTFQGLSKGRRVLVVLDDLCDFGRVQDWEDFQSLLSSCSEFGVLITTRNPKVATIVASAGSIPTVCHYLQKISDEDCGLILEKRAISCRCFHESKRQRSGKRNSEVIALQLAEKFCRGLPLVADLIGRHISLNLEDRLLELSKDLWEIPEFIELIFPHFRLKYSSLSVFLKNCFSYFALFPGGYYFNKDELIRLWLAEGYIKPRVAGAGFSESSNLEEVGKYHFDEVLSRSILQIYHPFDQEPLVYQMHELIHRYSRCVGCDLYLQLDEHFVDDSAKMAERFKKTRHLSLLCTNIPPSVWIHVERFCDGLRTVISLKEHIHIGQVRYTLFLKLQSLRVLNLSETDVSELPESVGMLEHLRLLDVSKTDIQDLPASISDLYELRFLKVDQCPLLLQLPKNIKKLTQLLHLEADMKGLTSMPPNIGKLTNLRTLSAFIAGRKRGFRVSELKDMKYLQGSICLTDLENVLDKDEAKSAMMSNKPFLRRIELEWNRYSVDCRSITEDILGGFEPHENLKDLQVTGYNGARFPSWLSSRECNLTNIHLLRCEKCTILPELGQLQHLKTLEIEEMHSVKCIDKNFSGFPSLESLKFQDMMSLEKWEGLQASQMPRLRYLNISDCPKLVSLPSLIVLTCLLNLEITCCPLIQALPEDGLPPSFETLIIVRCDLLKQRCLPEGFDWEVVSKVPNVVIDFTHVSTSC